MEKTTFVLFIENTGCKITVYDNVRKVMKIFYNK